MKLENIVESLFFFWKNQSLCKFVYIIYSKFLLIHSYNYLVFQSSIHCSRISDVTFVNYTRPVTIDYMWIYWICMWLVYDDFRTMSKSGTSAACGMSMCSEHSVIFWDDHCMFYTVIVKKCWRLLISCSKCSTWIFVKAQILSSFTLLS